MNRTLALLCFTLAVAGCRGSDTTQPKDMAVSPTDMPMNGNSDLSGVDASGGGGDMAMAMEANIHDIDTGVIPSKTRVTVKGAVVVGVAAYLSKSNMGDCRYQAFVQDASMAPSGIKLFATGDKCATPDGGGNCFCPFPPKSNTPLDDLMTLGDEFTIVATVNSTAFNVPDAGLGDPQHELNLDFAGSSTTKTGSGKMITPVEITDGSKFVPYATGWKDYECMLVNIHPAQPATTSAADQFGNWTFAKAQFGDLYAFYYNMGTDGGLAPYNKTYTSIAGVANPAFGGVIEPRVGMDFVP